MGAFAQFVIFMVVIGAGVAFLSSNKGSHFGGCALAVSLVGALTVGQIIGQIEVLMPVLLIALMLAFHWKSPAGFIIAGIYVARAAWLCVEYYHILPIGWFGGLDNRIVFWDINNGMVLLQSLVAIYGGMVNGGFRVKRPLENVDLARARMRRDIHLSAWLPSSHTKVDRSH